jgi:hypothetical protein
MKERRLQARLEGVQPMIDCLLGLAFIGLMLAPVISASFWHDKTQSGGN